MSSTVPEGGVKKNYLKKDTVRIKTCTVFVLKKEHL